MIKNIFLPEKFGDYYLFPKRIVGVYIGKTHIDATQLYMHKRTITIERCTQEKLPPGNNGNYIERVSKALQTVIERMDKFDALHTALPSSIAVIKKLSLPFVQHEKIKQVLPFEIEPLLPFAVDTAAVDFIVTNINSEQEQADIMVAAVQKQHIAQHMQFFEPVGRMPDVITLDQFALYGLYSMIPAYAKKTGNNVLIDIGINSTRISYITNGQLQLVRTIPNGTATVAKKIATSLRITPTQAMEHILRFGLEKTDWQEYTQAITQGYQAFCKTVQFTIASFTAQAQQAATIDTIVLLGGGAEVKQLPAFMADQLHIPCELFEIAQITQHEHIELKKRLSIPHENSMSLSIAMPSPTTQEFNLLTDEFAATEAKTFYIQFISGGTLIFILFTCLFSYYYLQVNRLEQEAQHVQQETLELLKEKFKKIDEDEDDLEDAINTAQNEVRTAEETWFAFSSASRASFLKYLLELASKIDPKGLGFIPEKISFAENSLTISAQVKDYEALKRLERSLSQSPLFKYVPPQDDPSFTMEIMLEKNRKES